MNIKLEKHFQNMMEAACRDYGCHVVPIPDDNKKSQATGLVGAGARASSKPYDFGLLHKGIYYAVECKMVKGPTLYRADIRPHQHTNLTKVARSGGYPILAIYFKYKFKDRVFEDAVAIPYNPEYAGNYVHQYQLMNSILTPLGTFDINNMLNLKNWGMTYERD